MKTKFKKRPDFDAIMKQGEWTEGMYLSEVKRDTIHDKINVRAWLEQVAIRTNPNFSKRKYKNIALVPKG